MLIFVTGIYCKIYDYEACYFTNIFHERIISKKKFKRMDYI